MVKTLGIDDARQVYEARCSIECFFAGKIYLNMKNEDIEYLRSLLEKQKECMLKQDIYGFTRENMAFHQYTMSKYANSIMEENYNRIIKRINLISIQNSSQKHRMEDSITEHQCFLQALFPQKCRVTSSKLHGEFPQYCISPSGTLLGAGEEPLQAYKVY